MATFQHQRPSHLASLSSPFAASLIPHQRLGDWDSRYGRLPLSTSWTQSTSMDDSESEASEEEESESEHEQPARRAVRRVSQGYETRVRRDVDEDVEEDDEYTPEDSGYNTESDSASESDTEFEVEVEVKKPQPQSQPQPRPQPQPKSKAPSNPRQRSPVFTRVTKRALKVSDEEVDQEREEVRRPSKKARRDGPVPVATLVPGPGAPGVAVRTKRRRVEELEELGESEESEDVAPRKAPSSVSAKQRVSAPVRPRGLAVYKKPRPRAREVKMESDSDSAVKARVEAPPRRKSCWESRPSPPRSATRERRSRRKRKRSREEIWDGEVERDFCELVEGWVVDPGAEKKASRDLAWGASDEGDVSDESDE